MKDSNKYFNDISVRSRTLIIQRNVQREYTPHKTINLLKTGQETTQNNLSALI